VDGLSVRQDGSSVFVVVRGLDTGSMRRVVAFGRGETVQDALRNVTNTIRDARWQADKFRRPDAIM